MSSATKLSKETIQSLTSSLYGHHDVVSSWLSQAPSPPPSLHSHGTLKRTHSGQIANEMSTRELSPSKRRRLGETDQSIYAIEDVENTPRAKPSAAVEPRSPSSFTSLSSRSHRSSSPKKKQPVRKMANLSLLPNPVIMRSIDDVAAALPDELEDIVIQLRRIGRGLGVIPRSERDAICSMPSNRSFRQILTDDLAFADDANRKILGPCPKPHEIAKIVSLAIECESNEHSEASWNGRVHTYLLDLALYNEAFRGKIGFLGCTRARIEPESLLPMYYAGIRIESKMVDFALYLDPDESMHDGLRTLATRDPFTTAAWNHTRYTPLQKRPVAISIETKLTGRDWDTAKTHTWANRYRYKLYTLIS
ncbi:hypothetical protein DM02DRAFT_704751 [Periconia macrospinosa]|uniref:PD-(D/E)XK nuclease-like domain-containing protein n=1 Tax=Periconia macrospinosa TaxID=97972 RepID=A0A2V1D0C5_9PLEO|nr:hypothetical protein DM02DRAFT_704751 [Periconia macrospinosa]